MQEVDLFDAMAFSMAESEAALLDPQQRLLLETVAEGLIADSPEILQVMVDHDVAQG